MRPHVILSVRILLTIFLCGALAAAQTFAAEPRVAEPPPLTAAPATAHPELEAAANDPHLEVAEPPPRNSDAPLVPSDAAAPDARVANADVARDAAHTPVDESGQQLELDAATPPLREPRADAGANRDMATAPPAAGSAEPVRDPVPVLIDAVKKIDGVFVPLQEWKEKKLQDIESRVKQRARGRRERLPREGGTRRETRGNLHILSGDAKSALFLSKRQLQFRELFSRACPVGGAVSVATEQHQVAAPHAADHAPLLTSDDPESPSGSDIPAKHVDSEHVGVPPEGENAHGGSRAHGDISPSSPPSQTDELPTGPEEDPSCSDSAAVIASEKASRVKPSATGDDSVDPAKLAPKESPAIAPDGERKNIKASLERLRNLGKQVVGIVRDPTLATITPTGTPYANESVAGNVSFGSCVGDCDVQSGSIEKPSLIGAPTGTKNGPKRNENWTGRPTESKKASHKRTKNQTERQRADSIATDAQFVKVNKKSFNFASEVAGAQILAASANAVGAKNIINENADKYMLVPCAGDGIGGSRWVDIELSEYVILKSVQTANYEHYSSSAVKLAVLGAEKYPPKKWNVLGVFDFANDRSVQTFQISGQARRKVSRFLRVVYAGKQGHEYYCPISIFRAFGKNLIADLKDGLEKSNEQPATDRIAGAALRSDAQDDAGPPAEVPGDARAASTAKDVHATDVSGIESVMKRAAAYVNGGRPAKQKAHPASADDPPAQPAADAKNAHGGTGGSGKGALSRDDEILWDVVREETLKPVSGDDNIFRQVARMIRLLELNQSLTNQYIDTHLAKYAAALAAVQAEAARGQEAAAVSQARVASLTATVDATVAQMRAAAFRRDMLLGALVALVGFLLGTHWVLWTALSGARLQQTPADVDIVASEVSAESAPFDAAADRACSPVSDAAADAPQKKQRIVETVSVDGVHVQMTDVRRRRKKGRERRVAAPQTHNGELDSPALPRGRPRAPAAQQQQRGNLLASNSFQLLSTDVQNCRRVEET